MATAQVKFERLLKDHLGPYLGEHGFRRRGGTFRRERDGAWQIIKLQRDRYSTARVIPFWINVGVTLPVLSAAPSWTDRGWPLEMECDFRARVGSLETGRDRQMRVRALLPLAPTARGVRRRLERTGLPWLDLHADPARALRAAVADPATMHWFSDHAYLALAHAIGTPDDVMVLGAELERRRPGRLEELRRKGIG